MHLLAIDIGNSSTKFGIFESSSLLDKFSIPTRKDYAMDELMFDRLLRVGERFVKYEAALIASVVPELNGTLGDALVKQLNVTPRFIDHTFDFGIGIDYHPPESAGVDRLVNASAAAAKYGCPVVACSFGTATTFDVVSGEMHYIGGAIAPGMRTLAEALHIKTSKLPNVAVVEEPAAAIGQTTEDSIKSGVFHGYVGMVEGVLERIFEELGDEAKVVGTGGFAKTVAGKSSMIDLVDEDLTLDGVRMLAERQPG